LQADLAPLALELAQWGTEDASGLAWLDPPPVAALSQARELLQRLEALDAAGRITAHGRHLLELPLQPRLAHMAVKGAEQEQGWLACLLAALISERDILPAGEQQADVSMRLRMLDAWNADLRLRRILASAKDISRQAGIRVENRIEIEHAGRLLALAYPDRIAKRRPGNAPRYLLSNGRGAFLREGDPLGAAPWLAVAELGGNPREARIYLAASVSETELRELFEAQVETHDVVEWNEANEAVVAMREQRLGAIVLEQRPLANPDPQRVTELMLEAIRRRSLECLPWIPAIRNWQARVELLRRVDGELWPAVDDASLAATLENWLSPFLQGRSRLSHLTAIPLQQALNILLDYRQQRLLNELAPTHFTVPTGSRIPIDYVSGETPVLAVRLQELFGLAESPSIACGKVKLLLHLLSPAHRPVQVTQDLAGFWRSSYQDVKKDMKGRYPKHHWPDDPLQAEPTRRVKKK
ncbi:MAG: ATP-dependent helicase C-terminal domain-containing protein, partial [Gammaproteobacteria bacterium]